jgi:hypothetical protein
MTFATLDAVAAASTLLAEFKEAVVASPFVTAAVTSPFVAVLT